MNHTGSPKPTYAALNLALTLGGIGFIFYSLLRVPVPTGQVQPAMMGDRPVARQMIVPRSLPFAPWVQIAGAAALLGAATLHDRERLNLSDYETAVEGVFAGSLNVGKETLAMLTQFNQSKSVKFARTILVKNLPAPIKNRMQQIEDRHQSDVVFQKFIAAPHNRLAGKTKAGKTFLLLFLLIQWLEANPDGEVVICDRNFGKPDRETGEPFYWNGFPRAAIRFRDADILQASRDEVAEMEQRITACREQGVPLTRLRPKLFILTELDSTQEETDAIAEQHGGFKGELKSNIRKLLKQANGYRMKVILDGQSLAVGESGISEATREQLCNILLGLNTTKSKEVAKFDSSNTDALIASCNAILKSGKRPGIVQLEDGEPIAIVIPDLSWIRDVRFTAATEAIASTQTLDPIEQWWLQVFTPDAQRWLNDLAIGCVSGEIKTPGGKGPLKELVMPYFGIAKFDDPRRRKLSEAWDEAKKRVKVKANAK